MLDLLLAKLLPHWPWILSIFIAILLIRNYFYHGLNQYPGPRLAAYTDLWRFFDVLGRRPDITHLNLHRKHGGIVRLGPNTLSFSSPTAIKAIYGLNKGFIKSDFYPVQQAISNGRRLPSLFSTTDETYHASLRRSVNHAFSMSTLKDYEPLVDETTEVFLHQTNKLFAQTDKICNFALWLQYFAFDVIGQITYSKRHGFIDREEDVDGMIAYLGRIFSYVAPIGQIPMLDLLLLKNPIVLWLDKLGFRFFAFPVATFAKKRMEERLSETDVEKPSVVNRADLLTMFMNAQKDKPEIMTDQRVLTMAVSMAFAGSETTAISLAAVFYHLLHRDASSSTSFYQNVMSEIEAAVADGRIEDRPSGLVSWAESQTLPYLDACIKEAFRMHPAVGLPLERMTPPDGVTIEDHFIPGNTIVGVSAWVVHKNESVFDPLGKYPVDSYRPDRWLDEDLQESHLKEMSGCMFHFGAGARTCIGKNISLLEVYKLVPSFLRRFDIEMADEGRGWNLHNAWFVKQLGFVVRFKEKTLKTR